MIYIYHYVRRYQPGSLNSRKMSIELQTPTKMKNMDEQEKKKFSLRDLLLPGSESPTETSGLIVYITSALTCKCSFTNKLSVYS